jgi:hypothetical protein
MCIGWNLGKYQSEAPTVLSTLALECISFQHVTALRLWLTRKFHQAPVLRVLVEAPLCWHGWLWLLIGWFHSPFQPSGHHPKAPFSVTLLVISIRQDPQLKTIRVCCASTLNCSVRLSDEPNSPERMYDISRAHWIPPWSWGQRAELFWIRLISILYSFYFS